MSTRSEAPQLGTGQVLIPRNERGWRSGFANLINKELSLWLGKRRWLSEVFPWVIALNGIVGVFTLLVLNLPGPGEAGGLAPTVGTLAPQMYFSLTAMITSAVVILQAHGFIIGEKQLGTAEWILSKPVSRPAFVLSKILGHGLSFLVAAIVLPGLAFYLLVLVWTGQPLPTAPFIAALGLLGLQVAFYLSLTVMLGTVLKSRAGVAGAALGFLFSGSIVSQLLPWTALVTPWGLSNAAVLLVVGPTTGVPATLNLTLPVAATTAAAILFAVFAVVRFERDEL